MSQIIPLDPLQQFKILHQQLQSTLQEYSIATDEQSQTYSDLSTKMKRYVALLVQGQDPTRQDTFDCFCEYNGPKLLLLLTRTAPQIALHSTSLLLINLQDDTHLSFLLCQPFITEIVQLPPQPSQQWTQYFISFLKSLAIRLTADLLSLFYNYHLPCFPLVYRAIIHANHPDSMVRTNVMNIVLEMMKLNGEYFCHYPFTGYMLNLLCELKGRIDHCKSRNSKEMKVYYSDIADYLLYINDILQYALPPLATLVQNAFLKYILVPVVKRIGKHRQETKEEGQRIQEKEENSRVEQSKQEHQNREKMQDTVVIKEKQQKQQNNDKIREKPQINEKQQKQQKQQNNVKMQEKLQINKKQQKQQNNVKMQENNEKQQKQQKQQNNEKMQEKLQINKKQKKQQKQQNNVESQKKKKSNEKQEKQQKQQIKTIKLQNQEKIQQIKQRQQIDNKLNLNDEQNKKDQQNQIKQQNNIKVQQNQKKSSQPFLQQQNQQNDITKDLFILTRILQLTPNKVIKDTIIHFLRSPYSSLNIQQSFLQIQIPLSYHNSECPTKFYLNHQKDILSHCQSIHHHKSLDLSPQFLSQMHRISQYLGYDLLTQTPLRNSISSQPLFNQRPNPYYLMNNIPNCNSLTTTLIYNILLSTWDSPYPHTDPHLSPQSLKMQLLSAVHQSQVQLVKHILQILRTLGLSHHVQQAYDIAIARMKECITSYNLQTVVDHFNNYFYQYYHLDGCQIDYTILLPQTNEQKQVMQQPREALQRVQQQSTQGIIAHSKKEIIKRICILGLISKYKQQNKVEIFFINYENRFNKISNIYKVNALLTVPTCKMISCQVQHKQQKMKCIILEDSLNLLLIEMKERNQGKVLINERWKHIDIALKKEQGNVVRISSKVKGRMHQYRGEVNLHFENQSKSNVACQTLKCLQRGAYQSEQAFILHYLRDQL